MSPSIQILQRQATFRECVKSKPPVIKSRAIFVAKWVFLGNMAYGYKNGTWSPDSAISIHYLPKPEVIENKIG
jgi:hypothetical protein